MERKNLEKLKGRGGIVLRYCDTECKVTRVSNPNEAMDNIAAVINEGGMYQG